MLRRALLSLVAVAGCSDGKGRTPFEEQPAPVPELVDAGHSPIDAQPVVDDAVVFIGAGDIASCAAHEANIGGEEPHELTARMIEAYPDTTPVFALGDNAYAVGSSEEFANCYDPTWGRFKDRTYPVPGNHEYKTEGAAGYFDYFGDRAGDPDKGYYSFDLGSWHVVALNSECPDGLLGVCDGSSPQAQWLEADLQQSNADCTIAMWHRPRFSSGHHGDSYQMYFLFEVLFEQGVDLALAGHEHDYERFAPMNADGDLRNEDGVRQIVVGTGGVPLRPNSGSRDNSEVAFDEHFGILELTLGEGSYEWRFLTTSGDVADSGSGDCH